MTTYVDNDGVDNVAVGIVKQARRDFIKGAKILYSIFKRVLTEKELLADELHKSLAANHTIRWMYDSWRFVKEDPYSMFGEIGDDVVIKSWTTDAIIEYYRELYLPGATKLYEYGVSCFVSEDKIREYIKDKNTADNFIAAKNYILELPANKEILGEWNKTAFERVRHKKKGEKGAIYKSEYIDGRKRTKIENTKKARELYNAGISTKAIAKDLGVSMQTVHKYLKITS